MTLKLTLYILLYKYQYYVKPLDSNYYLGLHFYVFDVIMIVDSSKRKFTDLLLDLKYKYQTRPLKKQIELYTIIKFIEIKNEDKNEDKK